MPMNIYGPCDGIFFRNKFSFCGHKRASWNPTISNLKPLPPLKSTMPYHNVCDNWIEIYGLGLDWIGSGYWLLQGDSY
jgi:hypothetical protein